MANKTIRQQVTIGASAHDVYEALMDSRKHKRFSGAEAKISRKVGGAISAYGGYITGANLELVPDEKIRQSWHAADFPEGHDSEVIFSLSETDGKTRITFTHKGVPEASYAGIKQGWNDYYWTPMRKMLEKS
jgi:activator of HSP90 ATPase